MNPLTNTLRCLHAEILRSLTIRTILTATFSSLIVIVVTFFGIVLSDFPQPNAPPWIEFSRQVLLPFTMLLLPVAAAMTGAHLSSIDTNPGAWKTLYALEVPRRYILLAKWIFLQALMLLSILLAVFGAIVAAWLASILKEDVTHAITGDAGSVVSLAAGVWLASLFLTTLHLWLGLWLKSGALAAGSGVAGLFSSFIGLFQGIEQVRYSPWFLPLNLVYDNDDGSFVGDAGPLSASSTITASLLGAAAIAIVGAYLHINRDVR